MDRQGFRLRSQNDILGYLDSLPLERIRPNMSYAPRGARELNSSRAIDFTAPLRPERQPQNPPPSFHMGRSCQRFSKEGQSQSLSPFEAQLDPTSYLSNTSRPDQPRGLSAMAPVFTPRTYAPPAPFQPRFAPGAPPSSRAVPPSPLEPRVPPPLPWRAQRPTAPPRRNPSRFASPNYRGDPNNPNNQSANIPESESTAIYVEGLPADCTVRELLRAARGTGKLWASNVSPPTPQHPGSCGKLVFWARAGADRLLAMHAGGRFLVRGAAPTVKMNRWRSAARPEGDPRSRVVVVRGPARVANRPYLDAFFAGGEPGPKFDWDTDEVVARPHAREGWAELEYRFACHRAQASEAYRWIMIASGWWLPNEKEKRALGRDLSPEERDLWAEVKVSWGIDPCDPNPVPPKKEGETEE
ncbi:hypothetical protein DL765_003219 [Monosporascus sp. GIB2]|nr:hypothetical protein DL765_003219 [Monosporascus sp. GIB2]